MTRGKELWSESSVLYLSCHSMWSALSTLKVGFLQPLMNLNTDFSYQYFQMFDNLPSVMGPFQIVSILLLHVENQKPSIIVSVLVPGEWDDYKCRVLDWREAAH